MGQRATGLLSRRPYIIDANTILLGDVGAGPRGRVATTRTGAAQLLTTDLTKYDVVKIVFNGQTSTSAGGYLVEAAHVAEGAALASASTYATIAIISAPNPAPGIVEIAVTGTQIREAVRAAGSLTGDVRVVAIRLTAGTGSNGAAIPAGTNTISLQLPI